MSSRFVSDQDPLSVPSDTLTPVDAVRFTDPTTSLDDTRPPKSTLDVSLDPSPHHHLTHQSNAQSSRTSQLHDDQHPPPSQQQHLEKHSPEQSPPHDISPLPTGPTSDPEDPDHEHASTTPLSAHRVDDDPVDNAHSTDPVIDRAVLPNAAATATSALDHHSVDVRLSRSDVGAVSQPQPSLTVLMATPIVPAVTAATHAGGAGAVAPPIVPPLEESEHAMIQQASQPPPVKKKRKTYSTEEERRQARILKNRRTAEESRQRRMKRMKELEEFVANSMVREKELQEEVRIAKVQLQAISESLEQVVNEKNAIIAQKDAEIQRLQDKLQLK